MFSMIFDCNSLELITKNQLAHILEKVQFPCMEAQKIEFLCIGVLNFVVCFETIGSDFCLMPSNQGQSCLMTVQQTMINSEDLFCLSISQTTMTLISYYAYFFMYGSIENSFCMCLILIFKWAPLKGTNLTK